MAARFRAKLSQLGGGGAEVRLTAFGLQEGYSTGWSGTGVVVGGLRNKPLNPGAMMSAVMARGVFAGTPMVVDMELGRRHARWRGRSHVAVRGHRAATPIRSTRTGPPATIHVTDPVSYLAERPVWGAFRGVSLRRPSGAYSPWPAAGDGKPATTPVLQGLPLIEVIAEYRDALAKVPYVIAAGQRLGDWLADFLAMLGLRAELFAREGGRVQLRLLDGKPRRPPLVMSVVTSEGADPPETDSVGVIAIEGTPPFRARACAGRCSTTPPRGRPGRWWRRARWGTC